MIFLVHFFATHDVDLRECAKVGLKLLYSKLMETVSRAVSHDVNEHLMSRESWHVGSSRVGSIGCCSFIYLFE